MEMRIVICDDEQIWINELIHLLKKYLPHELNYSYLVYNSGEECLKSLIETPADFLFMDIEMEGLSGIEVVRQYKTVFADCIVFFVTSHNTYFTDLFRLGSFQCLLKPINEVDFKFDLFRALEQYKLKHTKIEVKSDYISQTVSIGKILYIEVYKKQIKIRLKNEELCHKGSIAYYEKKLVGFGFVKTHKSFLVNLSHIQKITQDSVILDFNGIAVPLSRNYREQVRQSFVKKNLGECL